MAGGIEAAGDLATGALLGRAVEPHAGEHPAHGTHGSLCLNCGTALSGEFCHRCGQPAHVHSSLSSIGHDILHGAFHFEGKIWRTLPLLITRPGALTRRYIAGERARFVSPLALFLFCVFLMFAVMHATAGEWEIPDGSAETAAEQLAKADVRIARQQAELAEDQAKLQRARAAGADTADATDNLRDAQEELKELAETRRVIQAGKQHLASGKVETGWPALDRRANSAIANPNLALFKLQTNAYKFSWALIPISTPFVALLFLWRRGYKLYDHAIFVTYSLDFMTLFFVVVMLAGLIGTPGSIVALATLIVPPLHMYKQLRGAYRLPRPSALWRTAALLVFASIALVAFASLLLLLGIVE